jgi:type I restriction enzyme S subunit
MPFHRTSEYLRIKWRFEAGDILYGKLRPYFRKVVRPNFSGVCSTEIWVLRPREDIGSEYLEWVASTQEFTNFAMAGSSGTRMPRANWDHVRTFAVAKSAGDDFTRAIAASRVMWEQYWALHEENEELGRARDELLPLLLSGRVRVEDVAA